MAILRLRHPKGVTSIDIDVESDNTKVSDLQKAILSATEIPPSLQALKAGYPPRSLTLIQQLPVSSLGLQKGDQIIVTQLENSANPLTSQTSPPKVLPSSTLGVNPPTSSRSPPDLQTREAIGDQYVHTDGGVLVHRVVPDDNSCLFSSIGVVFEQDMGAAPRLRQLVADVIGKDPETYPDVFLGRPREDYMKTILGPNSWGGAIELSIFSSHYHTEICSIDVETGRIDKFGEDASYPTRVILLYSGIHYDATSLAPTPGAPPDWHQTSFSVDDSNILVAGKELAAKLRAQKRFTNTATFLLKCEICGKGLKGEKEATAHAKETGHAQFGEYS